MVNKMNIPEIQERRQKVLALLVKHLTESEISQSLGVSQPTISRDIKFLKLESKQFLDDMAKELFGFYYQQCIEGVDQVCRELWLLYHEQNSNQKTKLSALAILKDCYETKFRMLGEGPVVLTVQSLGERFEKIGQNSKANRR